MSTAPRPWRIDYEQPYEPVLLDATGQRVKGVKLWEDDADYSGGDLNVRTRANARLVVSAVNVHEDLLGVVEDMRASLAAECGIVVPIWLKRLDEVIAKARKP